MIGLLIFQTITFMCYVGYIIYKFGIIKSISDSYYLLEDNKKYLFTLFCWGIGFPLVFIGDPMFFFSGAGLIFTGVAADYKFPEKTEKYLQQVIHTKKTMTWWVHHIGAGVGVVFGLTGLWTAYSNDLFLKLFFAIYIILNHLRIKNFLFWIEIIAFGLLLVGFVMK